MEWYVSTLPTSVLLCYCSYFRPTGNLPVPLKIGDCWSWRRLLFSFTRVFCVQWKSLIQVEFFVELTYVVYIAPPLNFFGIGTNQRRLHCSHSDESIWLINVSYAEPVICTPGGTRLFELCMYLVRHMHLIVDGQKQEGCMHLFFKMCLLLFNQILQE